jgi:hypothetical protein
VFDFVGGQIPFFDGQQRVSHDSLSSLPAFCYGSREAPPTGQRLLLY